jgi:hypothetical protein
MVIMIMMMVQHTSAARVMMNSVSDAMSFNPRRHDATSCCGCDSNSGCTCPDSEALSRECLSKDMMLAHRNGNTNSCLIYRREKSTKANLGRARGISVCCFVWHSSQNSSNPRSVFQRPCFRHSNMEEGVSNIYHPPQR